jgi:protein transport protein SEC61 subunit alpha
MIRSALYQGIPSTSSERYDSDNNNNNSWDPLGLLLLNDREGLGFALVDKFGFNNTKNDREQSKTTTTSRRSKSNDKKKKNSKNDNDDDDNKSSSRSLTKTSAFGSSSSSSSMGGNNNNNDDGSFGDFFKGDLPQKVATILALLVVSRIGAYIPISGVDRTAFAESLQNTGGMMSYVDTLTGGSISKLGIFSLGIVPFINSSIIFQLLSSVFPELQKLQKEEGESGRRQFMQYQRYGALAFALIQAVGQCLYVRPYVEDFSAMWLFESTAVLTAGAMILMYIGEVLNELKLGNGTSLLIFANIVSSLPSSIGQTLEQSKTDGNGYFTLAVFFGAFLLSTLGVVYVQEAERKIPMQYSSKFDSGAAGLSKSSYLPFKVNSAGVMPIIFASSLMALPATLARFTDNGAVMSVAKFIYPGGVGYIPVNVALICFFNYFYTFLQLDPKDVAEQLKKQGASIPGVRPGKNTREYITRVLERLSLLGSVFLGVLALTPGGVEKLTGLQTFRGFAGTSLLILVGVATDSARKVKSELVMQKYSTSIEDFYKK